MVKLIPKWVNNIGKDDIIEIMFMYIAALDITTVFLHHIIIVSLLDSYIGIKTLMLFPLLLIFILWKTWVWLECIHEIE